VAASATPLISAFATETNSSAFAIVFKIAMKSRSYNWLEI
jgi:hypothetical protein